MPLTIHDIVAVARYKTPIPHFSPNERFLRSAAWVHEAIRQVETETDNPHTYYGINTGFGDNSGRATFTRAADAQRLMRNLLLSHTIGVGEHLPEDVVRAALYLRIVGLEQGYSGVRPEVVQTLIQMLNRGVYPAVPAQGSLGASGDLAPLAHLMIPLSAPLENEMPFPGSTGWCYLDGKLVSGADAMRAAGIPQIRLDAKEGIALINGTAISTAIGVLALHDALTLINATQAATALTVEAMCGFRDAFLPHVNQLRSQAQHSAATKILQALEGSTLVRGDAHIDPDPGTPPQDPYSIRCAPVVVGAALNAIRHVEDVLTDEINAVTDNPLIFADDSDSAEHLPRHTKVISGGNFHGEPVAMVMDYLAIAVAELANIAERRIFTLTDPKLNRGLPPFLIHDEPGCEGLNSGLMIAQYTAASLVSENKALAHPASVDSIPSSANREDHVSMSTIAARKAAQIVKNTQRVVAIELLCAAQALSLRLEQMPDRVAGAGSREVLAAIRALEIAPGMPLDVIRRDVPLTPYVDALTSALEKLPAL
jgi:histidine ammonia-lyase